MVKPKDLNYDHYTMSKYDTDIVRVIPGHKELHKKIAKIIKKHFAKRKTKVKMLELGIGTGLTAQRILELIPNIEYAGIDFSKTMLKGAKQKLSKYKVNLICGDFAKINFPKENDLVISVIAIHHQETNKDKKKLFKRIYKSLNKKGKFIFGDLVTYRNKEIAALNDAKHFHHLVENSKDEKSLKDWAQHHKFLNRLAPVADQIKWLKNVGFRKVKLVFKKFNTALIYAKK